MSTLAIDTARVFKPLLSGARYKGAWGGRGSGKSHFFAELLVERCILDKTHAVCLREVQESLTQSVKKLLEIKINDLGLGEKFSVKYDKIVSDNGSLIIFSGLKQHTVESIKSLEGYDIGMV